MVNDFWANAKVAMPSATVTATSIAKRLKVARTCQKRLPPRVSARKIERENDLGTWHTTEVEYGHKSDALIGHNSPLALEKEN